MAEFVQAVDPGGTKRRVPAHYLENKALTDQGFKLPPSTRKKSKQASEPASSTTSRVEEPAATSTAKTTVTEPAAAGEK
jgi:hypothetical protein